MANQERDLNPNLTPREDSERLLGHPEMVVPPSSDKQREIDRAFEDKSSGLDLNKPFGPGPEGVRVVPNADITPSKANPEAEKYARMIAEGDYEGLRNDSGADPVDITNALNELINEGIESEEK